MSDADACDFGSEPSDWRGHKDIFDSIDAESRDPLELAVQKLWVAIEMVKRETAEGDTPSASAALQKAKQSVHKYRFSFKVHTCRKMTNGV